MAAGKGDRGGSTNPADINTIKFDSVQHGNPAGRGGATNSKGFGPIGTYPLGTKPTNPPGKGGPC